MLGTLQALDQHRLARRVFILQPARDRAQRRRFRQLVIEQRGIQFASEDRMGKHATQQVLLLRRG